MVRDITVASWCFAPTRWLSRKEVRIWVFCQVLIKELGSSMFSGFLWAVALFIFTKHKAYTELSWAISAFWEFTSLEAFDENRKRVIRPC